MEKWKSRKQTEELAKMPKHVWPRSTEQCRNVSKYNAWIFQNLLYSNCTVVKHCGPACRHSCSQLQWPCHSVPWNQTIVRIRQKIEHNDRIIMHTLKSILKEEHTTKKRRLMHCRMDQSDRFWPSSEDGVNYWQTELPPWNSMNDTSWPQSGWPDRSGRSRRNRKNWIIHA